MAEADARQIEAEWWANWLREDYSWEGLARKRWPGWAVTDRGFVIEVESGCCFGEGDLRAPPADTVARDANLQDYWCVDTGTGRLRSAIEMADVLVSHPGSHFTPTEANRQQLYHPVHLPLAYSDGTRTPKDGWPDEALDDFLIPRIRIAGTDAFREHHALFAGAVLLRPPLDERLEETLSADFGAAAFVREARFSGRVGYANFRRALFMGRADFGAAKFNGGLAFFSEAVFCGTAAFINCEFASRAWFVGAYFSSPVQFRGALFERETHFSGAVFRDAVSYNQAIFRGFTWFANTRFAKEADFTHSRFRSAAGFTAAEFAGVALFDYARFLHRVDFGAAIFARLASFKALTWPKDERHSRSAFNHTLFGGTLVLEGSGCRSFTAFDGARLERGVTLDDVSETVADAQFRRELKLLEATAATPAPDFGHSVEAGLNALESGCRVLKQAMALQSDKAREQMFYRFELIARRKQKATPLTERGVSWLYGATSNYGESIGRPVLALLALVAAFAGTYWGLQGTFTAASAIDALGFSASRIFPFGAFEDVSKDWIGGFERADTLATLGIRMLASLESLIAIVLAFLLGLAVRRKFQIG